MRVVKEAEERKNEILDAAEELFISKGFDSTSTNDILDKVGIARGTLYYHFKSKEEILDSLIERMTETLMAQARAIAKDQGLPVLERMSNAIISLNVDSKLGVEVMQQVHKPQNALMHQKMQDSLISGIVPIMTQLAEEGIEQGIFHTDYPMEAVEMILIYSNIAFDSLAEQTEEERQRRIQGFIYHSERILGTGDGVLQDAIMKIFC